MKENENKNEKVCAFYASDYHFEMITIPYINQIIETGRKIVIFTENNLKASIEKILSRKELEKNREKILDINWGDDDLEKFKYIKENTNSDTTIFIKGSKRYIEQINRNVEIWKNNLADVKVIDCFSIEEVGNSMIDVLDNYSKVLITAGEQNI